MIIEKFFAISQVAHEITLWVLILLSIFSITFILEKWFFLKRFVQKTKSLPSKLLETLASNNLEEIEEFSRDRDSIEGRALTYGLRHVKEKGTTGLEEFFNSYALIEKPLLEKRLGFLATV